MWCSSDFSPQHHIILSKPRPMHFMLFPYTTLFRSQEAAAVDLGEDPGVAPALAGDRAGLLRHRPELEDVDDEQVARPRALDRDRDRKSTRLNSSHVKSSYAVFCLKKKNINKTSFIH